MSKVVKRVIIGVAAFVVLVGLLSSLVITKENEYTLITRFSKIDRIESEAGLSFKIPFVDGEQKLPKQILLYDLSASDVITKDKKTMIADSYVLWKITDPQAFSKTLNRSVSNAESRIDAAVYNATKNAISSLTQNEVIASRDGELQELIMANIGDAIDSYGIEVLSVEIKQMDLPEDNKEAVYERMISERNQIAASYQAEGDSEAKKIRNTTDKEISIMLSDAEADAAAIIAEGESEYMRILAAAYNTEERADFYAFTRALDAAKASMSGSNKTLILPKDSPLASIFMSTEE
ncbi:MAG: protease modulator HflC [Lachnospiraceae bacterium]|nr:protease modulator HflC [Lachnospiraceae bacterium]